MSCSICAYGCTDQAAVPPFLIVVFDVHPIGAATEDQCLGHHHALWRGPLQRHAQFIQARLEPEPGEVAGEERQVGGIILLAWHRCRRRPGRSAEGTGCPRRSLRSRRTSSVPPLTTGYFSRSARVSTPPRRLTSTSSTSVRTLSVGAASGLAGAAAAAVAGAFAAGTSPVGAAAAPVAAGALAACGTLASRGVVVFPASASRCLTDAAAVSRGAN